VALSPTRLGVVAAAERLEALEGEEQVRAPLARDHRVDLVDDDRLDPGEDLPRPRGEEEVERLGGRDEHLGRVLLHALPLGHRGVSRPDPHRGHAIGRALALRHHLDARQRRAEVALDVHAEGLQRGDVEHPHARLLRRRAEHEAVDRGEERAERLSAARRREEERGAPSAEVRPALLLRGRRRLEGGLEPATGAPMSEGERVGHRPRNMARAPASVVSGGVSTAEELREARG